MKKQMKIILKEILLTILLVLVFQYIMGKRTEYYDMSKEPIWNGSSETISKGETYIQKIKCTKDKIVGVAQYIETPEAVSGTELALTIYDHAGKALARTEQTIEPDFMGYRDIFLKEELHGLEGRLLSCEYRNLTDSCLVLKNGYYEGVLCNAGSNICTRLIYHVLDKSWYKRMVYISGILIWLILSVVLILLVRKQTKTEYLFAFLYLALGIMYMAVNPLYGVPDEGNHFLRAYGITEGDFITGRGENGKGGSMLPVNITYGSKGADMKLPDVAEAGNVSLDSKRSFITYGNTALYSPFTYTAQVIGIFLGKLFSSRVVVIAYCGRVAAWLLAGIILFFSIRYLPFGQYLLMAISLLPMNMHESISLAGDSFTYAVAVAFVSFVLYVRYRQTQELSRRQYVLLYVLLFYLASCKIVYMPLSMLAFLIPKERFGSRKKYYCNIACAISMIGAVSISWLAVSSGFLVEFRPGVDSGEQVRFILTHPMDYVEILFRTILDSGLDLVLNMLGISLGHFNVPVGIGIIAMAAGSIIYAYGKEKNIWMRESASWQRGFMLFACVCTGLLIYTSLYVQWTAVGEDTIDGVQGRYFLPVLLPILFALTSGKKDGIQVRGISNAARQDGISKRTAQSGNVSAVQNNDSIAAQDYEGMGTTWYLVLLLTGILTVVSCLSHYVI